MPQGERRTVPAGKGLALRLAKGELLQVVNTHGEQVCDVWSFLSDNARVDGTLRTPMSMHHSHDAMGKLCPGVGDTLVSAQMQPMLTLVEDSGPGVHDTTVAACTPELYVKLLGAEAAAGHDSCTNNLHVSLATLGYRLTDEPASFCTPCPINLWMATPPLGASTLYTTDSSRWGVPDPRQKPGVFVVFRAEANCVVAMSACPASDVSGVNGANGSHDCHVQVYSAM